MERPEITPLIECNEPICGQFNSIQYQFNYIAYDVHWNMQLIELKDAPLNSILQIALQFDGRAFFAPL